MFDKTRVWATVVYLSSIAATLTVALWKGRALLGVIVVLLVVQFAAGVWYALSYIPFARATVLTCLRGLVTR